MSPSKRDAIRIVLIDDHALVRAGVRSLLERDAALQIVGEAGSAAESMPLVESLRPDVVVLDVGLPDADGSLLARRIRDRVPLARVVVLTMYADEEHVHRAVRAGVDAYLLKTCRPEDLLRSIHRVAAGEQVIDPALVSDVVMRLTEPVSGGNRPRLSLREREILRMLSQGATSKEIAADLGLSPKTVDNHRARILTKLGAANTAEAIRVAIAADLIPSAPSGRSGVDAA